MVLTTHNSVSLVIMLAHSGHDKWVPVTTAWLVLRLRLEERPPVWRVAANIVNKSCGQPTRGGPPAWGLGELLTTPHRKNWPCYEMGTCASDLD